MVLDQTSSAVDRSKGDESKGAYVLSFSRVPFSDGKRHFVFSTNITFLP